MAVQLLAADGCWQDEAAAKKESLAVSQRNATNRRPNSTVATQETAECDGTQW